MEEESRRNRRKREVGWRVGEVERAALGGVMCGCTVLQGFQLCRALVGVDSLAGFGNRGDNDMQAGRLINLGEGYEQRCSRQW